MHILNWRIWGRGEESTTIVLLLISDGDGPSQFDADIKYFRRHVIKSIKKSIVNDDGSVTEEYFDGASSSLEIDVFAFYKVHAGKMPALEPVIKQLLGHPSSSESPETVFSYGKYLVTDYRTALHPSRLEQLMLSGANYHAKRRPAKNLPKLPELGVPFSEEELVEADDAKAPDFVGVDADITYDDDISDGSDSSDSSDSSDDET